MKAGHTFDLYLILHDADQHNLPAMLSAARPHPDDCRALLENDAVPAWATTAVTRYVRGY
jgi:hypothetical protein